MQTHTEEEIGRIALRLAETLEQASDKGEPYTLTLSDLKDLAAVIRSIGDRAKNAADQVN